MPTLELVGNEPAGIDLRLLTFATPLSSFDKPGQFVTVSMNDLKPAFFAIASVPGEPLQLLVKQQGDVASLVTAAEPGTAIEVSDAMGGGFPLPEGDARKLVILATGSGISAVRSVIEAEIAAGLPRPVHVLYGVFTLEHRSFVDRLEAWRGKGVVVHEVLSEPHHGWEGAVGFVQDAAKELGLVDADSTVVLCGFPAMVEAAKALYGDAGAAPEQLLTNY
jgi:NAD(P)H-flavin reductase